MKYAHIVSKLTSTPWLATGDVMESIVGLLNARISGKQTGILFGPSEDAKPQKRELYEMSGSTAVIDVSGVIGKRLSSMETMCGGIDVDSIRYAFDSAMADAGVQSVLLAIDSPGGTVTGVPELAAHISASKSKPVIAYTDTLAASGGYYLAAAADAIYASETAQVGSIGAIARVVDESTAIDRAGLKVHTFKSGKYKDSGTHVRAMTEEEAVRFQAAIDAIGNRFRADVKANRPLVTDDAMDADVYTGLESLENKLIDGIYNTRAEVLALMAQNLTA